jgi:DNA-binding IscR family transcriptional regulator
VLKRLFRYVKSQEGKTGGYLLYRAVKGGKRIVASIKA